MTIGRDTPYPVTTTADLVYHIVDGVDLHVDLHRPDIDADVPVVVYVHGGGWAVGDRKDALDNRILPVARGGIAVASIQYRLTHQASFPAQLLDCRAAVGWLREAGAEHGLLVERIGSWGSSAGALLAVLLGLDSPLDGAGRPTTQATGRLTDAVVAWGAPLDLRAALVRSWLEAEEMPVEGNDTSKFLGATSFDPDNPLHRAADPLGLISRTAAPMQFAGGDRDHMVPLAHVLRAHERLVHHGVESTVLVLGGAGHEGAEFDRPDVIGAAVEHFRRHLGVADEEPRR
jgi:acetyl esterase/lipase